MLINVDNIDKEGRTAIHRAVKAKYRTVDSVYREQPDGSKNIVVRRKKGEAQHSTPLGFSTIWFFFACVNW